jgi:hypothetical protein
LVKFFDEIYDEIDFLDDVDYHYDEIDFLDDVDYDKNKFVVCLLSEKTLGERPPSTVTVRVQSFRIFSVRWAPNEA